MELNTKYNVDECVITEIDGCPIKVRITRIIIHVTKSVEIWYVVKDCLDNYFKKPEEKINTKK